MKKKAVIFYFIGYTILMFLYGQFIVNRGKPVWSNVLFALVAGVLFTFFYWLYSRRRSGGNAS